MKQLKINIFLLLFCTIHINAQHLKIENSIDKIRKTKTSGTRLNRAAFEQIMLESQNQDQHDKLANQIVLGPHSQIKGIDIHGHTLNKKLSEAQEILKNFMWGTNSTEIFKFFQQPDIRFTDFIENLIHAKDNILLILTDITNFVDENPGVLKTHSKRIEQTTQQLLELQNNILDALKEIDNVFDTIST
jgi:hypothetical protein